MMNKVKSSVETIISDITDFYELKKHHFLSLNGVMLDENRIEIQWIFCEYGKQNSQSIFFIEVTKDVIIPSVTDLLPSAIISQRELVDMFGVKVEDSEKGLYLDEDSLTAPLGCTI